tara:strand:+ start:118 stop:984 length:867 start_codon:yes stop_codon:yes gene_type:complete
MQENTESKKPNEAKTPENEEDLSDEKPTSKPSESSEFELSNEEQEGKVLPPEKKKSSKYGLFLFILLLLTGGSSYLLYTNQIPPQIKEWIEPLLKPLKQRLAIIKPVPAPPRPPKKLISGVKEKVPDPTIQKETLIVEEKSVPEITPSLSKEKPISDSEKKIISEVKETDSNYPDKVAGTPTIIEPKLETLVEETKAETLPEEPKNIELDYSHEIFAPPAPTKIPYTQHTPEIEEPKFAEPPIQFKKNQKNKAVQAYLDFFETTLVKIGELIKAGFAKGKGFLIKYLD